MTASAETKTILVSVDVEPDVAMFVQGTAGLSAGLPQLSSLFRKLDLPVDFFFTLDAARQVVDFVRELTQDGQWIGCHGRDHKTAYYSKKSDEWQRTAIREATAGIHDLVGCTPRLFRAPNFSISGPSLQELDSLGYIVDSSVLPGRHKKRCRVIPLLDHRGAPRVPYHPDPGNPCLRGPLGLWEVPVTENPIAAGGPIGLGFVNAVGPDLALRAVREARVPFVTILCHTWEAIDLGRIHPSLPTWLAETCRSDLRMFEQFLRSLRHGFTFKRLQDLLPQWGLGHGVVGGETS